MRKNFTKLITKVNTMQWRPQVVGLLLLFMMLASQTAVGQVITGINPTCAIANQNFTLTVTGTGFSTSGSNSAAVTINGSSAGITVTGRTGSTALVATVSGTRIATAGIYQVRVSQGSGGNLSVSGPVNLTVIGPPTAQGVQRCGPGDVTLTASGAPQGAAYQWYDPSGTAISGATNSTLILQNQSSNAVYSVAMTAPGGCGSTRTTVPVTINTVPTARVTASSTTICSGGSVLLTAEATPAAPATGNYTYQWRNGGANIPGATSSTYNATTSGDYSVIITNPQGNCPSNPSEALTITVNPLPAAPTVGDVTRCGEGTVTFAATLRTNSTTARWYESASGGSPVATSTSFSPSVDATTTYYVSGYNETTGCESSSRTAVTATVLQTPTVNIATTSSTTICGSGSALLTATVSPGSPGAGNYEYQWFEGGDAIAGATNNTYNAGATGNYSVVVSISNADCTSERSNAIVITVLPNPTLVITNPEPVCSPGTVDLTVEAIKAGSTSGLSYSYWTNAAATAALSNPDAVNQSGTYYIKGTTNAGCFVIEPVVVTINTPPTASINGSNSFCEGGSTELAANAVNGATYQWLLNGEEINGADERTLTVAEPGDYAVVVTRGGCSTTSDEFTVTETPLPTATITPRSATEFCAGGSVILDATTGSGYTYRWFREGSTTVLGTENNFTATTSGNYYVEITRNTCIVTSEIVEVIENQFPDATITPTGPVDFCQGGSVVLNAVEDPDYTYQWFLNGEEIENNTGSSLTVTASGSYTVVVNNSGCERTSSPIVVRVSTQNTAAISVVPPTTFCQGGSALLTANLSPEGQTAYTYSWLRNGATIPGETGNTYAASQSGDYQVVVSNGTCTKTSEPVTITVNPLPTATISGETAFCEGGSVTLRATAGTNYTYQWFRGDAAIAGATEIEYVASVPGNYTVRVTSESDCSTTSAVTVVTMTPLPVATISTNGPTTFCAGSTVTLSSVVAPQGRTFSYQWLRDGQEITQNGTSRQYVATVAGDYTVRVTDATNGLNCTATTATPITVTVNPVATAAITTTGPTTFCAGGSVQLDAIATPATPDGGGTYTYQWYNQSGIISGATDASFTVTATGNYSVVIVNSASNCTSAPSAPVAVTVNPIPSAPTAPPVAICGPGQVTLTASGTPSGGSYRWYNVSTEGTPIAGATSASYTTTITSTTTFYVSAVSAGCESGRTAVTATVNTVPVATVTTAPAAPTTFCSGGSVVLTAVADPATPASGSYTYQWRNGSTNIPGANAVTYTATTSGNYSVIITNPAGSGSCASSPSAPVTITVNPTPAVATNVRATPTSVCDSGASTLSATAGANGTTVRWYSASTGGELLHTGLTFTPTVTATSTYYAASFNATTGCESSTRAGATVTVNATPATPTITNLTAGRTYYTGERYNGNFFLTLTGSAPPAGGTASFSGPGVTLVDGAYRFTPCNALPAGQNEGAVTITYTVRSTGGCERSTSTTINVRRSTYTVVLQTNPFPVCPGTNTNYTARVLRDAVVTFPDPANIRTQAVNVVSFEEDVSSLFVIESRKNNGTFNRGAVYNDASLSSTDYYESRATPRAGALPSCASGTEIFSNKIYLGVPNVNISISRTGSICPGTSVTFTASQGELPGNLTYQWTINGVAVPGATSSTFTSSTLQNGDRVALAYAAANSGCGSVSAENFFTMVVAVPQTFTGNFAYCTGSAGTPIGLQSSQVGISYQLIRNGVNVGTPVAGTGNALPLGVQPAGTYTVQPISANGACSPAYGPIAISETPLPTVFNVTGGGEYCAGGTGVSVGLSNSQSGVSYQLYNGSTPVGSPIISTGGPVSFGNQTVAGAYTVVATTVSNGTTAACPRNMNGNAIITINPLPTITVNSPSACVGTPVQVVATPVVGTAPFTYSWSVPAGATNPGNTSSFTTTVPGTYTVRVTDGKSCTMSAPVSTTVVINELPTVTVNSLTLCENDGPATIEAVASRGSGNYSYTWTVPAGAVNPGNVASFTTKVAGNYTVRVTDTQSCASEPVTGSVTVNPVIAVTGRILIFDETGNEIEDESKMEVGVKYTFKVESNMIDLAGADIASIMWWMGDGTPDGWVVVEEGVTEFTMKEPMGALRVSIRCEIPAMEGTCFALDANNIFSIITEPIIPLPVELLYFNATKRGNDVMLDWATASELDNKGFEVQVSSDAKNFITLGFVESKVNTTSLKQVYSFVDKENGKQGVRYYRLKQVDLDGKFETFNSKAVHFDEVAMNKLKAYPNPFHSEVELSIDAELDGELQITVTTATGQQLLQRTIRVARGTNTEKLMLDPNLPRGVYIISTRMGDFNSHFKLLKQ